MAVVNLPFVSPAYLAKQAATVDILSRGRLDLGLGIGWMPEEFEIMGASTARRGARTEEYLAVLRTLWADEVSSYQGEFYQVPAGRQDPRPVQRPGPPVLLGGMFAFYYFNPQYNVLIRTLMLLGSTVLAIGHDGGNFAAYYLWDGRQGVRRNIAMDPELSQVAFNDFLVLEAVPA